MLNSGRSQRKLFLNSGLSILRFSQVYLASKVMFLIDFKRHGGIGAVRYNDKFYSEVLNSGNFTKLGNDSDDRFIAHFQYGMTFISQLIIPRIYWLGRFVAELRGRLSKVDCT